MLIDILCFISSIGMTIVTPDTECAGPPPLHCALSISKPAENCLSEEDEKEFGYGEFCKVLDSNEVFLAFNKSMYYCI